MTSMLRVDLPIEMYSVGSCFQVAAIWSAMVERVSVPAVCSDG